MMIHVNKGTRCATEQAQMRNLTSNCLSSKNVKAKVKRQQSNYFKYVYNLGREPMPTFGTGVPNPWDMDHYQSVSCQETGRPAGGEQWASE